MKKNEAGFSRHAWTLPTSPAAVVGRIGRPLRALALVLLALVLASCKREPKPCGGLSVDSRPLPESWTETRAAFPAGTMCRVDDARREEILYAIPAKSREEVVQKWDTSLGAKGWSKRAPTETDLAEAMRGGTSRERWSTVTGKVLSVFVSSGATEDVGVARLRLAQLGTCVEDKRSSINRALPPICTVNHSDADRCKGDGGEYFPEDGARGVARCRERGYAQAVLSPGDSVDGTLRSDFAIVFRKPM